MHHRLSTIMTGAAIVLSAATLAGCAGAGSSTAPTASVASATPTPTAEPVVDLGDAVIQTGADGKPVVITDAAGSYQKITINPEAAVFALDPSTFDETVKAADWSDEDVLSAQQWFMTFLAEQGIDSIAVDGLTGWEEWKATKATEFVAPEWSTMYESADQANNQNYFIVNNPGYGVPTLIRDGMPRVSGVAVSLDTVRSFELDGTNRLAFEGVATVDYRVTDAERTAALQRLDPGATDDEIAAQSPGAADGMDEDYKVEFIYEYAVRRDDAGGWLIIGYENTYNNSGL